MEFHTFSHTVFLDFYNIRLFEFFQFKYLLYHCPTEIPTDISQGILDVVSNLQRNQLTSKFDAQGV